MPLVPRALKTSVQETKQETREFDLQALPKRERRPCFQEFDCRNFAIFAVHCPWETTGLQDLESGPRLWFSVALGRPNTRIAGHP